MKMLYSVKAVCYLSWFAHHPTS